MYTHTYVWIHIGTLYAYPYISIHMLAYTCTYCIYLHIYTLMYVLTHTYYQHTTYSHTSLFTS